GGCGELWVGLQRLARRSRGERKSLIVLEMRADLAIVVVLVRGRRCGGILGLDVGCVLESRPGRQPVDLDDARIAHIVLHAEGVAHRAGDDLQFLLVLVGERHQHDEKAYQKTHEIGEGDEPTVAAAMSFLAPRHGLCAPSPAQAGTGSGSSCRCFSGRYASSISRTKVGLLESRIISTPSMIRVRLISSSTSLRCSLSAIGRHIRLATTAPYSVASSAVAMNGPSLDGSVMLANICTMPTSVPIMPKAGAQSPT